jgi:hypothetical protein
MGLIRSPVRITSARSSDVEAEFNGMENGEDKNARQRSGPAALPCAASTKRRTAY